MNKRPYIAGLIAADALLALFVMLVTSISGWATTKSQFGLYWFFLVPLAVGFGIQVGLYVYLRETLKRAMSKKVIGVTGGTSAATMIACCAHYLVNILPIVSAAGVAAFIGQYQVKLFWVGLAFNLFGIVYVARQVVRARQHLVVGQTTPEPVSTPGTPSINNAVVVIAFVIVVAAVSIFSARTSQPVARGAAAGKATSLSSSNLTKTNSQNGMTVAVTPQRNPDGSWEFLVAIDNHAVDVTQDMVAVSSLVDTAGQVVSPKSWTGDPPGGHHRQGRLTFMGLTSPPISLTIRDLGEVPEWIFTWDNLTS